MTTGQRRALVALALAISIVTALLMLPAPPEGSGEGLELLFPDVTPQEVVGLQVRHPAWPEVLRLERRGQEWVLVEPGETPADQERVAVMLRELTSLEVRDGLDSTDLQVYGLEPAKRIEVILILSDDRREELAVGGESVGTGTYLLVDGVVLPAEGLIGQAFPASDDELRDHRVWRHSVLDSVAVTASGIAMWSLERHEQGWFHAGASPPQPAPSVDVDVILQLLEGMRVASFPERAEDPGELILRLELADAEGAGAAIDIFEPRLKGGYLAKVPRHQDPVVLDVASVASLLERCSAALD